jgi:hypothetical protein
VASPSMAMEMSATASNIIFNTSILFLLFQTQKYIFN